MLPQVSDKGELPAVERGVSQSDEAVVGDQPQRHEIAIRTRHDDFCLVDPHGILLLPTRVLEILGTVKTEWSTLPGSAHGGSCLGLEQGQLCAGWQALPVANDCDSERARDGAAVKRHRG